MQCGAASKQEERKARTLGASICTMPPARQLLLAHKLALFWGGYFTPQKKGRGISSRQGRHIVGLAEA
eukprot:2326088-Amphidinium_carterae.1